MQTSLWDNTIRDSRLERRNMLIKEQYINLTNKKYKGKRMYHSEMIMLKLSEKFYLAERTIENIIFRM